MFTSIRKYQVKQRSAEELARRVPEGFVPLVRQMRGSEDTICSMTAWMSLSRSVCSAAT